MVCGVAQPTVSVKPMRCAPVSMAVLTSFLRKGSGVRVLSSVLKLGVSPWSLAY